MVTTLNDTFQHSLYGNNSTKLPDLSKHNNNTNLEENLYLCKMRCISFARSSSLQRHKQVRAKKKQQPCQLFPKSFSKPFDLYKDVLVHQEENLLSF